MFPTDGKWKYFERLVTAIHRAADKGAEVRWDEAINGRQFDVTIRFRQGLYEYLTVVECKHYAKPVAVEKVEAFIIKSSDVHAHHAVMASTSGFQSGAQEVARRHNLTLIHVTESDEIDISIFGAHWCGTTDLLHIESIEIEYADGERKQLPKEAHVMTYYAGHVIIRFGSEEKSLDAVVQELMLLGKWKELDSVSEQTVPFPKGSRVIGPDDGEIPLKPIACVRVRAGIMKGKVFSGPVRFDPSVLAPDVYVQNVASGAKHTFRMRDLPLGVDTVLKEGRFYEQPQFPAYYYCDRIVGDIADIYVVESFQFGQLLQAKVTVEKRYWNYYVELTDSKIIDRLQRRLHRLKGTKDGV